MALLELRRGDLKQLDIPEGWDAFLTSDGAGLELRGDDTGGSILHVATLGGRCLLGFDTGELLDRARACRVAGSGG